jgi:hypothetical protein
VTVKPGQPLKVLKVTDAEVQVSTLDDRTTFTAEPGETDVLAVAQQAFAKLTPKQRALSFDTLLRQKELWPQFVTLKRSFDLAPGKTVRAGDQVELMNLEPGGIAVKSESLKATFKVVTDATDLMTQARKLVEDEKAAPRFVDARKQEQTRQVVVEQKKQNFGPVITELEDKLVSSVTGKPAPLDTAALPRYIVFYRGSSTCPITRQFTPTLLKYYQQMHATHPEFEVVYMMTEGMDDTSKFAKELGFSWRAISYASTSGIPSVHGHISGLLPQLIVMDRNGRILVNGTQSAAPAALRQLDALLKRPAAR